MPEEYLIGIDGGGTRSSGVAVARDGRILHRVPGGPLNFHTWGSEQFRANLAEIQVALEGRMPGGVRLHTVVGTAGVFVEPTEEERHLAFGRRIPPRVTLVGDAVAAVYGATVGQPGILVISGTGSIAIGIDDGGKILVRGGLGPALGGDPGSAYWMATEAILQAHNEQPPGEDLTSLGRRICGFFGVEAMTEIVGRVCGAGAQARLAAASAHLAAAESPDETWLQIERRAADHLAQLVKGLARAIPVGELVYVSGSVLFGNPRVRAALEHSMAKALARPVFLEEPRLDPSLGAALIAMREVGIRPEAEILRRLSS